MLTFWARSWFCQQNRSIQGANTSQCNPLARICNAEVGDLGTKTAVNEMSTRPNIPTGDGKRVPLFPIACYYFRFIDGNVSIMAHYAIGDLQGCYRELTALLQKIEFNHGTDTLWLVGDIVNRGEQSLECLQFCMAHPDSVQMVLGNHDLHLLAIIYGHGRHKRSDTLQAILNHPQLSQMRDWLRQQPLMVHNDHHVLVHAGLLPEWTVAQAQDLADEVQQHLRGNQASDYFANMYGNQPDAWAETLTSYDRLRCITNALTRMRVLTAQNQFEPNFKSVRAEIPEHHYAWFDAPNRQHLSHKIVFGHWSALGFVNEQQVIALDTGALWGGQLTAIDLATEQITQIQSQSKNDWRE